MYVRFPVSGTGTNVLYMSGKRRRRCPHCAARIRIDDNGRMFAHLRYGVVCRGSGLVFGPDLAPRQKGADASWNAPETLRLREQPARWKPVRPDGKRECNICTNSFRALNGPMPVVAHFDYATHRWCPGGMPPTDGQRARRKVKASLRAASAGLPSLGRKRS